MIPKAINKQNIILVLTAFMAGIGGQTTVNFVYDPRPLPWTSDQADQQENRIKDELRAELKQELADYANQAIREKMETDLKRVETMLNEHLRGSQNEIQRSDLQKQDH